MASAFISKQIPLTLVKLRLKTPRSPNGAYSICPVDRNDDASIIEGFTAEHNAAYS